MLQTNNMVNVLLARVASQQKMGKKCLKSIDARP
jgi:hypothetical protein